MGQVWGADPDAARVMFTIKPARGCEGMRIWYIVINSRIVIDFVAVDLRVSAAEKPTSDSDALFRRGGLTSLIQTSEMSGMLDKPTSAGIRDANSVLPGFH